MELSVLDVFVLSMLERGCETPYDLHRNAGLSLGAISPCVSRLLKERLVARTKDKNATKRPRHHYTLTTLGKEQARTAWKAYVETAKSPNDLDSLLRVVDLALHYHADRTTIARLLQNAASERQRRAKQLSIDLEKPAVNKYVHLRTRCETNRLFDEAQTLLKFSQEIGKKRASSPYPKGTPTLIELAEKSRQRE
jgi:DNA-binding PadR family transcriptional regulator